MRKLKCLLITAFFLLLSLAFAACTTTKKSTDGGDSSVEEVHSIEVLDRDIRIYVGDSHSIIATYIGENTLTYTPSNEEILQVTGQGVVTGKAEGVAFVEVSDGELSVTCKFTVLKAENYISLSTYDTDAVVNSKTTIVATIYKKGEALNETVTFACEDTDLQCEANGNEVVLYTDKVGYYTVKATYGELEASCTIKIVSASARFLPQPTVAVENCKTAKWAAVENADTYKYKINGGDWTETNATEFDLSGYVSDLKANENLVITVKALAKGNFEYIDSLSESYVFAHTYSDEMLVQYTCVEEGTIQYSCTVCGVNYTIENYTVPHTIKDGECTVCNLILTDQIIYDYDEERECYFVKGPDAGFAAEEVYFLAKYNDGKHGEHPVEYVGYAAFQNNSIIKRVIMPSSITLLKGLAFDTCKNLEYVSMVGVSLLEAVDQATYKHDNFRDCYKLTQVIVGDNFENQGRNWMIWQNRPSGYQPQVDVYVYGTTCKGLYTDYYSIRTEAGQNNNLLTGTYYLYDETSSACLKWHFAADGETIVTVGDHVFVEGACKKCGAFDDQGISYSYDAENECYFVDNNQLITSATVEILPTYNDGVHGVHSVAYVGYKAFFGNTKIKKVILPDSVTQLDGMVFQGCSNLEYVSMTGVGAMQFVTIERGYLENKITTNNNFLGCTKLTTLIVNKNFDIYANSKDAQQFLANVRDKDGNLLETTPCIDVYVNGYEWESNVNATPNTKNDLLTGNVYYLGDLSRCQQWRLTEDDEIERSSAAHNYTNGQCTCGAYETKGITYGYDAVSDCYYVLNYVGVLAEVEVLGEYDDGTHGKKAVAYVANSAFLNNTTITKVVLPENVTQLDGMVFQGCTNLEYVSMTGITDMAFANIERPYRETPITTNNNFHNCVNLTTLIVNKAFNLYADSRAAQQFGGTEGATACIRVYVAGTEAESAVSVDPTGTNNLLLTGEVYYLGNLSGCKQWKVNEAGEIETSAAEHTYESAQCTNCGAAQTVGISYAYDETAGCYYVAGYTGTSKEVYVASTYDDGTHEEKAVAYVAAGAFKGNTNITKVVLPDSVTQLDGTVFQGCTNLTYVSMTGITDMTFANITRPYQAGNVTTNNNFHNCVNLTTLVVNKAFNLYTVSSAQQFGSNVSGATACIALYVAGTEAESTVNAAPNDNNKLLTGTVYYYSESAQAGSWHYENGVATPW